jgi:hypothetical protein
MKAAADVGGHLHVQDLRAHEAIEEEQHKHVRVRNVDRFLSRPVVFASRGEPSDLARPASRKPATAQLA